MYYLEMYNRMMKKKLNENRFNNVLTEAVINEMLLEAKSPEQIADILCRKFPYGDPDEVRSLISKIMEIDPTKKYSYTQWLVSLYDDERDLAFQVNDEETFEEIKNLFQFAKQNNDFQLQTFDDLDEAFDGIIEFEGKSNYEVLYEDEKWIVYVPYTYAAERYIVYHLYGGASWCTASSNGEGHFENYTDEYNLYIFANKQTNEIYQYSPKSGEFNDSSNEKVDYPAQLVGGKVYDFFEDRGMYLDQGSFPTEVDLYWDGNYGMLCVNDLYEKYHLCDSLGHELSTKDYYMVTNVNENYENYIVIETSEDRNGNYYVIETTSGRYDCVAYFNDVNGEPFFWGMGSVIGMGDNEFSHVSFGEGKVIYQEENYDGFETVSTRTGYYFILETYYDSMYRIYDPYKGDLSTYTTKDGKEEIVEFWDDPYYDEKTEMFYGNDENGLEIGYNPKTREYTWEGEDEEDELVGVESYNESVEKIKSKFNTILESISKPMGNDKIKD